MHDSVVADAGGLLVLAGLLEGIEQEADEILALDATSLLLAEYLVVRHQGAPQGARVDFASVGQIVREWFPVRGLAIEGALSAGEDIDGHAALSLASPLVCRSSRRTASFGVGRFPSCTADGWPSPRTPRRAAVTTG